jgi:hypothetical protein
MHKCETPEQRMPRQLLVPVVPPVIAQLQRGLLRAPRVAGVRTHELQVCAALWDGLQGCARAADGLVFVRSACQLRRSACIPHLQVSCDPGQALDWVYKKKLATEATKVITSGQHNEMSALHSSHCHSVHVRWKLLEASEQLQSTMHHGGLTKSNAFAAQGL